MAISQIIQNSVATNVAGTGPAFSAYSGSNQSLTANTLTLVNMDTKVFDTANCYNTSTKAYTPNVAGYYLFTAMYNSSAQMTGAIYPYFVNVVTTQQYQLGRFYVSSDYPATNVSLLVYMNGTTDSITFNVGTTANSTSQGGLQFSRFSGVLVRAA
jgi:hypothetical protein